MTKRCGWVPINDPLYTAYHDKEWGTPIHEDKKIFEFLVLESAQAGLAWITVLRKRENYRKAFAEFDPTKVASFTEKDILNLLTDKGIIRNKAKITAAVNNAKKFIEVQKEFGSFNKYIWGFVQGKPIINKWTESKQIPAKTELAEKIAKDMKTRGFNFLGPTIIYSHMQATGMVDDHTTDCFRHTQNRIGR
jgi:DNA-3-methyladenine glycosylase I